ncbi:PfkB family carbohydrate kinase [Microbacterium sp. NPDC089180]|uniref:PfkB family carbohydrate kinase n=1 Tax=unclassified Microbacterium TaxID=2609290 RepID=UPI00342B1A81
MSEPRGVFVGLTTLDVVHVVDRAPAPNEKVTATAQFLAAGGPAANAAVTFAALGGEATLVTAIGRGSVAEVIVADLERHGVRIVDLTPDDQDRAPVSAVSVNPAEAQRSVVSIDATGASVSAPTDARALVGDAAVVLIDGHHPALAVAVAEAARQAGRPVVVDAGRWKPVMADLIDLDPHMLCSDDFRLPGTDTADDSARELRGRVGTVVTTHGGAPVDYAERGSPEGRIKVPPVKAVDTLGAGDVFHGAYAFALAAAEADIRKRIAFAARIAGRRVATMGPREWLSTLDTPPSPSPSVPSKSGPSSSGAEKQVRP